MSHNKRKTKQRHNSWSFVSQRSPVKFSLSVVTAAGAAASGLENQDRYDLSIAGISRAGV